MTLLLAVAVFGVSVLLCIRPRRRQMKQREFLGMTAQPAADRQDTRGR